MSLSSICSFFAAMSAAGVASLRLHGFKPPGPPPCNSARSGDHFNVKINATSVPFYPRDFATCISSYDRGSTISDLKLFVNRKVLMLGNSVMRGQYFALVEYLRGDDVDPWTPTRSQQKEICPGEAVGHLLPVGKVSCSDYVSRTNTTLFFRFEGYFDTAAASLQHMDIIRLYPFVTIDIVIVSIGLNHLLRFADAQHHGRDLSFAPEALKPDVGPDAQAEAYVHADIETALRQIHVSLPTFLESAVTLVRGSLSPSSGRDLSARVLFKTVMPIIPKLFDQRGRYWQCSSARNDYIQDINSAVMSSVQKFLAERPHLKHTVRMVDDFNSVFSLRKGTQESNESMGYEDFSHPAAQLRHTLLLQSLCAMRTDWHTEIGFP
eukprot:gnl/TRDRNA2_/TRDRNA2_193455_c0_seq1.p1 gnl/TRDRNA2_/TRDRNA2_193455_c0~~gnl/TRDRNA2_/TRDRNA2_193455_c0_seq1.p1  ORF type:complete len:379 (+),score=23.40 gnl/TRDRNA2_/TRDRNA2_193455_c0_seq1:74-1210(+)